MDIVEATRSYEAWLGEHTPIVRADVRIKHAEMRTSPFVFLRGTFYRWAQVWPEECADLAEAPAVLSVGDLHLENFGTWRDREGRLVWGVNDADEAFPLPYTNDLVRLATSATLAKRDGDLGLSVDDICDAILEGYRDSLRAGGRPVVLAEKHTWLRAIAVHELRNPSKFWDGLLSLPPVRTTIPRTAAALLRIPPPSSGFRVSRRRAGIGSLGRPRFVAVATQCGAFVAREVKAMVPSACVWARGAAFDGTHAERLLARAVRARDPFYAIEGAWSVRRLSPDCAKIDVADLPGRRFETKLLRAMGWETANVHVGSGRAKIGRDASTRGRKWLKRATRRMVDVVIDDWRAWKKATA